MTSKSGLSGEGGVVSQGRRALLPKSPETLATGTTPLLLPAPATDPASAMKHIQLKSFQILGCKLVSPEATITPQIIEADRLFFRLRRHVTPHFNP